MRRVPTSSPALTPKPLGGLRNAALSKARIPCHKKAWSGKSSALEIGDAKAASSTRKEPFLYVVHFARNLHCRYRCSRAAIVVYKFILRRPRPKGAIPISAGIAMILFQIVLDYGWYSRATADFGDDVVVLRTAEGKSLLQPLSYIIPRTDRFLALNKATMKSNNNLPACRGMTLSPRFVLTGV